MSRTVKGSKPPNFEYWAKRFYSIWPLIGGWTKRATNRAERRIGKQQLKKEIP